jgi:hypothetical protein
MNWLYLGELIMEISKFILPKIEDDSSYQIKLIPDKVLNKMTDYIIVSFNDLINCNLSFKKNINRQIIDNQYSLTRDELKRYINFLNKINNRFMNNEHIEYKEFIIKNGEKIVINSLNQDCVKMCSIKNNVDKQNRNFFVLFKDEFTTYIKVLKQVYFGNKPKIKYDSEIFLNPITKKERDEIYLEALYVFANGALDLKDKRRFEAISSEIKSLDKVS